VRFFQPTLLECSYPVRENQHTNHSRLALTCMPWWNSNSYLTRRHMDIEILYLTTFTFSLKYYISIWNNLLSLRFQTNFSVEFHTCIHVAPWNWQFNWRRKQGFEFQFYSNNGSTIHILSWYKSQGNRVHEFLIRHKHSVCNHRRNENEHLHWLG